MWQKTTRDLITSLRRHYPHQVKGLVAGRQLSAEAPLVFMNLVYANSVVLSNTWYNDLVFIKEKKMPQGNTVLTSPKEIRSLARFSLNGFWVQVFICYFIFIGITQYLPGFISRFIPGLSYIYELEYMGIKQNMRIALLPYIVMPLLNGPFTYGLSKLHLRQIRERQNIDTNEIFSGFKQFGKTFGTYIAVWATMIIAALPFMAVGGLVIVLMSRIGATIVQVFGSIIYTIAVIGGMIAVIYVAVLLSMTFYILVDSPSIKPVDAAKTSAALMKTNVGRYIVLKLSYLGWWILGVILSSSLTSLLSSFLPNTETMLYIIGVVTQAPILFATIYMDRGEAFFYEFAIGHLRKSAPAAPIQTQAWT